MTQLLAYSAPFMEQQDSLLSSSEPATVLSQMNSVYSFTHYVCKFFFNIILASGRRYPGSLTKVCFSTLPCVLDALSISSSLI